MRQSILWLSASLFVTAAGALAQDLTEFPLSKHLIDTLVAEHEFERDYVEQLFKDGRYIARNVENLAQPAERTETFRQYRPRFISPQMVNSGLAFMEKHQQWLDKAETELGVPAEIVAAIIGIETSFGNFLGQHRTFDALATLAVTEGRRAEYFQREFVQFMLIMRDMEFEPLSVVGSYAGAMGYPQFMPTSYNAYAIDHNGDGTIDIWNNPADAIGSVANYLAEHGWKTGEYVATSVTVNGEYQNLKVNSLERDQTLADAKASGWEPENALDDQAQAHPLRLDGDDGPEYWLGYQNFWVISRYNRSILYSMAVFQLAEELRLARENAG
ncbi:MAG: lytic murein transglycosylase B [Saccharospirillum sp.]|nr:lytic murein transglycosylase B [Saccharospirillum sp.]